MLQLWIISLLGYVILRRNEKALQNKCFAIITLLKVYAFSTQANICDLIDLYYGFLFTVEVPIRISLFCSMDNNNLAL